MTISKYIVLHYCQLSLETKKLIDKKVLSFRKNIKQLQNQMEKKFVTIKAS